jgi:CheY-like chemotaxis protein
MLAIVNDLLDIARIESGRFTIEALPVRLDEVVTSATRALVTEAQRKGLELVVSVAPDLPLHRLGDPLRLTQVVTNLVGNALKFTERGQVEVQLAPGATPELVRLSVRDTGLGIPPARLQAIFDAFTQSDGSTTRRFGGTGLGLTITRELARLMGGDVEVESAEGAGSTFTATLRLPLVPGVVTALRPQQGAPPTCPSASKPRRTLRVLLAEDNAINATLACRLVERAGHEITHVWNGAAAVEATREGAWDLVLMDVQMPVLDGLEATRRIRALEEGTKRHLPIVAMTANAMGEDRRQCQAAGMDAFLSKPVDVEQLKQVLEEVATKEAA